MCVLNDQVGQEHEGLVRVQLCFLNEQVRFEFRQWVKAGRPARTMTRFNLCGLAAFPSQDLFRRSQAFTPFSKRKFCATTATDRSSRALLAVGSETSPAESLSPSVSFSVSISVSIRLSEQCYDEWPSTTNYKSMRRVKCIISVRRSRAAGTDTGTRPQRHSPHRDSAFWALPVPSYAPHVKSTSARASTVPWSSAVSADVLRWFYPQPELR